MTKKLILKDILAHFRRTTGEVTRIAKGCKSYIAIKTDHGKARQIGHWAMCNYPKQIQTFFVCNEFRQAHLSIYFNR